VYTPNKGEIIMTVSSQKGLQPNGYAAKNFVEYTSLTQTVGVQTMEYF
jgi:hypothetical protein